MSTHYGVLQDGQPVEIAQGDAFTTYQLLITTEEEAAWSFEPVGTIIDFERNHPNNALEFYTPDDLTRYCIQTFEVTDTPDGQQIASYELAAPDGAIIAAVTFEPIPVVVPPEVSAMQAQILLERGGQLAAVQGAVNAAGGEIAIYWNKAATFHRDHPSLEQMRQALGWTAQQLDELFIQAAQIT